MQPWKKAIAMMLLAVNSIAAPLMAPRSSNQQITDSEKQEAREIAILFTTQFVESKDLTPLVQKLYVSNFIDRYKRSKLLDLSTEAIELYFIPGLDYSSRLLTEGSSEDWQRFYIAANNLYLLGFLSLFKTNISNADDLKVTDLYPSNVIRLLNRNPNLANMLVRKGPSKAVSSVNDMRSATMTLEQATAIMREKHKGISVNDMDRKELIKAMEEDAFFQPRLEVLEEEYFGFPRGTRITLINAPLLFRLMLVRNDNETKVFWAEPYAGG